MSSQFVQFTLRSLKVFFTTIYYNHKSSSRYVVARRSTAPRTTRVPYFLRRSQILLVFNRIFTSPPIWFLSLPLHGMQRKMFTSIGPENISHFNGSETPFNLYPYTLIPVRKLDGMQEDQLRP